MGSQGATFAEAVRMVVKSGGNWKRPVNRMYTYNFQIGENYYLPMTSYLEGKNSPAVSADLPGPLCFSERISLHPLSGTSVEAYADQSVETIKKTRQVISSMYPGHHTHTLALVHTGTAASWPGPGA